MTIEADIKTALNSLVSNRVYPDFAPAGVARPYITYQQIGGEAVAFMERSLPSKKNGHFQINVFSDTRAESASLAIQIEQALVTSTAFQCNAIAAPIADYDYEVSVYWMHQDFSIWSDR